MITARCSKPPSTGRKATIRHHGLGDRLQRARRRGAVLGDFRRADREQALLRRPARRLHPPVERHEDRRGQQAGQLRQVDRGGVQAGGRLGQPRADGQGRAGTAGRIRQLGHGLGFDAGQIERDDTAERRSRRRLDETEHGRPLRGQQQEGGATRQNPDRAQPVGPRALGGLHQGRRAARPADQNDPAAPELGRGTVDGLQDRGVYVRLIGQ
jgi:hypothetical protein